MSSSWGPFHARSPHPVKSANDPIIIVAASARNTRLQQSGVRATLFLSIVIRLTHALKGCVNQLSSTAFTRDAPRDAVGDSSGPLHSLPTRRAILAIELMVAIPATQRNDQSVTIPRRCGAELGQRVLRDPELDPARWRTGFRSRPFRLRALTIRFHGERSHCVGVRPAAPPPIDSNLHSSGRRRIS